MEKEIKCPHCGKETRQNKHGKSKAGSQRYLCKHCNKTYVTKSKWMRYNKETKNRQLSYIWKEIVEELLEHLL